MDNLLQKEADRPVEEAELLTCAKEWARSCMQLSDQQALEHRIALLEVALLHMTGVKDAPFRITRPKKSKK